MPKNVFSQKAGRLHEVFRSEKFLHPEFVPERMPFRDAQIDALVNCLSPLARGGKATHSVLLGDTGAGKTACAKYVLRDFEAYSDRAKGMYFNCFAHNSRHAVLCAIANALGSAIPRRGTATDEAYAALVEFLKKSSFVPIVVLDEFDQLRREDGERLLYDLLRTVEHAAKTIPLILISNRRELLATLEPRVRSSLGAFETISFERYSPVQLKQIMLERAKYAFHPDALSSDAVDVIAGHAARLGGDARTAIESLLAAGREAERQNAPAITAAHARTTFSDDQQKTALARKRFVSLDEDEKTLLSLVRKQSGITSGALYDAFYAAAQKKPVLRLLRMKVTGLLQKGLLRADDVQQGRGKTRALFLAVPETELDEHLA